MTLGVPRETFPGEKRVALVPKNCEALTKAGISLILETGAGDASGYLDEQYTSRGAAMGSRSEVFGKSDIVVQVRTLGANVQAGRVDLPLMRAGQTVIGFAEPLTAIQENADMAATGVSLIALELVPRITRAQSMDVLSSMATVAGYHAVLLAAKALPKMFPMLMTAAGTIKPAKVLVLGAGVAGLQAISTARRLGAVVSGYDVRAAVKEQVESLGARFVELAMDGASAEGSGGYAKAMDENFYRRQRELLTEVLREQDVVITTAAVPGKRAPVLITASMASAMAPGSVIVDIAAERGGNCELTRAGETVMHNGIAILGPVNLATELPFHASQMYSANVASLLKLLAPKGELILNLEDEIIRETLVTHGGKVVHARIAEMMQEPNPATAGGR